MPRATEGGDAPTPRQPRQPHHRPIVEVRRNLTTMRKMWAESTPDAPFELHAALAADDAETVAQFAHAFVLQHHQQRTKRAR